jgi:hypothetical protein
MERGLGYRGGENAVMRRINVMEENEKRKERLKRIILAK